MAAEAAQRLGADAGLDFLLLGEPPSRIGPVAAAFGRQRDPATPRHGPLPILGRLLTNPQPGWRENGMPHGAEILVAPDGLLGPHLDTFDVAAQSWASPGIALALAPTSAWASEYAGFVSLTGFAIRPDRPAEAEVAAYYLQHRYRIGLFGLQDLGTSLDTVVAVPAAEDTCTQTAVLRQLKLGHAVVGPVGGPVVTLEPAADGSIAAGSSLTLRIAAVGHGQVTVYKNGRPLRIIRVDGEWRGEIADQFWGPGAYHATFADDAGRVGFCSPRYVRSTDWLWGDHHLHYYHDGLAESAGLDYVVYGTHSRWGGAAPRSDEVVCVPGGEIHGTGAGDQPDTHVIVIQRAHEIADQEHLGLGPTLRSIAARGDLAIIAHPRLFTPESFHRFGCPGPDESGFEPEFDGIEIINAAPGNHLRLGIATTSVGFSPDALDYREAEAMWDRCLARGMRVVGVANSDCHGPWRDGLFANNLNLGRVATIVRAAARTPAAIVDGLSGGDCWFTDGDFRYLDTRVNGARMGAVSPPGPTTVMVIAEAASPIVSIEIVADGEVILQRPYSDGRLFVDETFDVQPPPDARSLRVRMANAVGQRAFGNPVYIVRPTTKHKSPSGLR